MQRVSLVGVPGSGKTTAGRLLADLLQVEFIELDAIVHQKGWNDLPLKEFRDRVTQAISSDGWVIDGNYQSVRDLVWGRADTVVWFDLPRSIIMRRIIARTIRRALTREELWNENHEPLTNLYRWDPNVNVIRWAWVKHPVYAKRYLSEMHNPANSQLNFVRLRTPEEVDSFLVTSWAR